MQAPSHPHATLPLTLLTDGKKWDVLEPTTKYGDCRWHGCKSALMDLPPPEPEVLARDPKEVVLEEALNYLDLYKREKGVAQPVYEARVAQVRKEIAETGTYVQTSQEISYGAKVAWRNAGRCINRIQWNNIEVRDCRHLNTGEEIFRAVCDHLKFAWNGGKLISTMSVFKLGVEFWSPQFFRYAGYRMPDGTVKGDPSNLELTAVAQKLGWVGQGTEFDLLPLVFHVPGEGVSVCEIPLELQFQVNIEHPTIPQFKDLGLKWSCIPVISNMSVDIGGIKYTATPFSGWFMNTEIASRNLLDAQRYNLGTRIAKVLNLDTTSTGNMWRERVMLETNVAVLHSFRENKVSIVDHHSAAEGFMMFYDKEIKTRGKCPADWVWLVPPMGGSSSVLFHLEMVNYIDKPMYYNRPPNPWRNHHEEHKTLTFRSLVLSISKHRALLKFVRKFAKSNIVVPILFASETGRSEMFANTLAQKINRIKGFKGVVHSLETCDFEQIFGKYLQIFVVTSTFGNGNAPRNGVRLEEFLKKEVGESLVTRSKYENLFFSVFGLGSRAYENFCGFARYVNDALSALGALPCIPMGEGDELAGQERAFNKWADEVAYMLQSGGARKFTAREVPLPRVEVSFLENTAVQPIWQHDHSLPVSVTNAIPIKVIENQILADKQGDEKILIKFEIPAAVGGAQPILSYEAGDHLVVFPENSPQVVQQLLVRLGCADKADAPVSLALLEEHASLPVGKLPQNFTLRDAFERYFDLTKTPEKDLLKVLRGGVQNEEEKRLIEVLLTDDKAFRQWKDETMPSVLDLFFKFFPTATPPNLSLLLPQLDVILPRSYSIASSQNVVGSQVDLLISINTFTPPFASKKVGLCSSFLRCRQPGDMVRVTTRKAESFRLPINKETGALSAPVVMVAAGSGLAPFRGFLQELSHLPRVNEQVGLFYGCRFRDSFVCDKEVAAYHNKGVISQLHVAHSREGNRIYVQDAVHQQSKYIWEQVLQRNGRIYVCGDLNMSNGVRKSLVTLVSEMGQMSEEQAAAYVQQMVAEKRLVEDIFGLNHTPSPFYAEGSRALWAPKRATA